MSSSIAHSAARGTLFTLGAQGAKILLQLASVVVLSRLLTPHDYGLLTIVLVVIGVGEIFRDFGLTSASVQAETLSIGERDNLFWVNSGIGLILAFVTFGLSWPLSAIVGEPELRGIMQVLCAMFLLNGLATQYRAQLMRALRFRSLAMADVIAASVALVVAISAALAGLGYWSLVLQQLTSGVSLLVCLAAAGRWLPRAYSRSYPIRRFISFGWNIVASNLLSYGASQLDTILVAAKLGPSSVGLYNRAYQLVTTPLAQLRSPITNVALPILSRIQTSTGRFDTFVLSAQIALGYGFGVPLILVCGMAEPVVRIMLGPQWMATVPILRCFALAGLLTTLPFVGYWVYVSRGLANQLFRYTMVTTAIRVVCIVTGSFFGMVGIAVGFAVAPAIAWPISIFWLSRITPMPTRGLYLGAARILAVALSGGAVSWLVSDALGSFGPWMAVLGGAAAAAVVVCAFLLLPPFRADAAMLFKFVRLMLKRQRPEAI